MEKVTVAMSNASVSDQKSGKKLGFKPLAAKMPKNPSTNLVDVDTNIRKLDIAENQPIYKYSVKVIYQFRTNNGVVDVEFSKSTKSGTAHEEAKERCQKVYLRAAQILFPNGNDRFFYDRQASLYTLKKLTIKGGEEKLEFTDNISNRPGFEKAFFFIKDVAETFQATTRDIKKCANECPAMADKTILEAVNSVVSGPALANPSVITIGSCIHYLAEPEAFGITTCFFNAGQRYSGTGAMKAVKVMEGADRKNPGLYMVTEIKETLFHPDNTRLLDLFQTHPGFRTDLKSNTPTANTIFKANEGLEVYLDYGINEGTDDRVIVSIKKFGPTAAECTFVNDAGNRVTVLEYFAEKFKYRIQYPNLFTIEAKGRKGRILNLPVEVLMVCNSQKVTTNQMQEKQQADMIKLSAAPPQTRRDRTNQVAEAVGLAANNMYNFVRVEQPLKVKGVKLPYPKINFAGNTVAELPNNKGKIATDFTKVGNFFEPKSLQNWEVCFIDREDIRGFAEALTQEMQKSGMTVKPPVITRIVDRNLRAVFQSAKNQKRQLIFFVIRSKYEMHQQIKALEQEFDVLTQELRGETADKFFKQPQTRQNVVNKTNMKLGGLNYLIRSEYFTPDLMIIGFETAVQSTSGDGPVSVGFAANMMGHGQKFSGGYIYVPKTKDIYGPILKETMIKILQTARANKANKPTEIIVYFNGITEGQYGMINEEYQAHIRNAWAEATNNSAPPKFTLIASSKTHNERLYQNNQNRLANLAPGTVVDHSIVSPVFNEFYLASAVARQGTTKTVKYTIIFTDREKQTMQRLETLTNDLCYDHQIVFHPVSLPVPLYIAGRNSQRGSMVLGVNGPCATKEHGIDYEATNKKLGYYGKSLFGTRFNA